MYLLSRKGFTLWEVLFAILIGIVVFASVPAVFHTVWNFWNVSVQQEKAKDLRFVVSDILNYSPDIKNIDVPSDREVVLELYNGCTVDFSYNSNTKVLTKQVTCPQGQKAGVSYKTNLIDFEVNQSGEGVEYKISNGKTTFQFYQKPL